MRECVLIMSRPQGEQPYAPCRRLRNASAAACHGLSARRGQFIRRPSPLSTLAKLFSFSTVPFVALLYSVGDLPATVAGEGIANPHPDPQPDTGSASDDKFHTWGALKDLGKHAAQDARLAYRTAAREGSLVVQHASGKAQAVGGKIYESTQKAYGKVASTSSDALRAARRALERIRTAARSAWKSTKSTPKRMWTATGRGVHHLGKWMLMEGDGN